MLSYITWSVNPEIFPNLLPVRWYGLLFAAAFFFGYLVLIKIFKHEKLPVALLDQLALYVFIATIIGARLGHVLFYEPDYFLSNPLLILKIWQGGLASHGAAIGILIAIWLFSRKNKIHYLWVLDRLVIVIAFLITQRIEDIVNDTPATVRQSRPSHFFPSFILIFSGLLLLLLPSQPRNSWYETDAKTILSEVANKNHYTDADEIAFSIMQGKNYPVLLVDVRDPESFQRFTLPGAINIPLNDIFDYNWESIFDNHNQKVVLFSYSETQASEAWLLLRRKGYKEMKVLEGGLNNFMNTIFIEEFIPERKRPDCIDMHTARFRTEAKEYFTTGKAIKKIESPQIPVIKIVEIEKPISGGC
jgi:rhodanese-related sulfurtransferase